jgi:hypothetical protein
MKQGAKAMTGLLRPGDLKEICSSAEMKKMEEERELKKKIEQQQLKLREAFMSREIHPQAIDRVNNAIRTAAQQGHNKVQVLTFPCTYCDDRGRRINNLLPDWPESLEGFAKKAYEFFEKELRPLGYKLTAEIISFDRGIPSEVGLFLKW